MSLDSGTRLGPYEVTAAIGAGGMGEVYQARDTALNRDVAIKVLPESLAGDPDRLARFQPEAKAMRVLGILFSMLAIGAGCSPSGDRVEAPVGDGQPSAYLADTESRLLTSSATGRTYQISVALPRGYSESDQTYPVLYAVDANGEFGTVVEAARMIRLEETIPQLVIVGIGYPVGRFFDATAPRALDLTPTEDPDFLQDWKEELPEFPIPEGSGGAPGFLEFVRNELIPLVESEYRVNEAGRGLYGHSFGGLFALYALLEGEGTFQRVIAGSPSLWWDDGVIFRMESEYAGSHDVLDAQLFLSVGLLEVNDGERYAMVSNLEQLVSILDVRDYGALRVETAYFGDETHNSVIAPTVSRGLRAVYRE